MLYRKGVKFGENQIRNQDEQRDKVTKRERVQVASGKKSQHAKLVKRNTSDSQKQQKNNFATNQAYQQTSNEN